MRKLRHDFNFILGVILVALVFLPVLVGFLWTPYEPNAMDITAKSLPPSLMHWFGTDYFGRDVFSRVMEGARMTFLVGAASIAIGAGIGIFIGALTGFFGGWADELLMRINDGLASFPSVLLALVLVSVFGSSKYMVILALGIVFIPSFARVSRSEFIAQKERDYVKNARLMGAGNLRIMFVHILPNTRAILLSAVTIGFNNAVLAEAGLSYLSIGAQPTDVSLGRMLADAQGYLMTAPWFALAPGLTIVFTVLGFSLISEAIAKPETVKKARKRVTKEEISSTPGEESVRKNDTEKQRPLLQAKHLSIGFHEDGVWDTVVQDANFELYPGEILGVVGESGSGKSMTALAVMGLLKENGRITNGALYFDGQELTTMQQKSYCKLRGASMSMVFQEPMTSLNPVLPIGKQVEEMLHIHGNVTETGEKKNETYRNTVLKALSEAGLMQVEELYEKYPHELSGGMRQRVMIAMAMLLRPKLLIADEPTTALDVTIQAKILTLLKEMNQKYGTSIIFISHDLSIIKRMCDRVIVMHEGRMVEQGTVENIFKEPKDAYTKMLLEAALGTPKEKDKRNGETNSRNHIIDLDQLNVYYKEKKKKLFGPVHLHHVVKNVTLHVREGEILGIVGESGCGKSSLARAIVGLQAQVEGNIRLGEETPQMVFQDPYGSLNPSKRVGWILEEPLRHASQKLSKSEREQRVKEILAKVELPIRYKNRFPSELSGGQRQRVAIALALSLNRKLIVLDEPVSALDVTVQAQILELLLRLRKEDGLSYIFISHDMQVIRKICDYVCVMYQGEIVEHARTEDVFEHPQHAYTKKLLEAAEWRG